MKKHIVAAVILGTLVAPISASAYGGAFVPGTIGITNAQTQQADYRAMSREKLLKIYKELLQIKLALLRIQLRLLSLRHE